MGTSHQTFYVVQTLDRQSNWITYVCDTMDEADRFTIHALNSDYDVVRIKLDYSLTENEIEIYLEFKDIKLVVKGSTLDDTRIEAKRIIANLFSSVSKLRFKTENKE